MQFEKEAVDCLIDHSLERFVTTLRQYYRLTDPISARGFKPRRGDRSLVSQINGSFAELSSSTDKEIADKTIALRQRVSDGQSIQSCDLLVATFALVKEAARRTIGLIHYDEQLLAGIALSTGAIAEMQTGEGKTLASTLPAVLHALSGRGVHIATVNAYLAERDFQFLSPLYALLGLTVGYARDGDAPDEKRQAYSCDITYATGYELGFDYLRDQVALRQQRRLPVGRRVRDGLRGRSVASPAVQRGHAFVIIDEVDSVLIDEANTPLILSAPRNGQLSTHEAYLHADDLAKTLDPDCDYVYQAANDSLKLTELGSRKVHGNMPRAANALARPWSMYVEQSLRAQLLYERDVHYVIRDDVVQIVDEYTGRIFTERSWRDGLHQAVEAKERVPFSDEKRSIARISRQRYFQMYAQLCGMTGTANGHEREFRQFYGLPVVSMPLRKPNRRERLPTRYFASPHDKWESITEDVARRHRLGQPVLVGTRTIANSRQLASQLTRAGVPFRLLNGVQDEDEAALVAAAGERSAVTIATNMAGRGTDIVPTTASIECGGLHVIAAEHHDSQRIDRQLAGRAARQGDPGSCQFFVSAEDDLLRRHAPQLAATINGVDPDGATNQGFDESIKQIQQRAEQTNYEKREKLLRHEIWLDGLRSSVA